MSLTPSEQPATAAAPPHGSDLYGQAQPHVFPGDHSDDDGQALDSYFEPPFHGPESVTYLDGDKTEVPSPNRMLVSTVMLPATHNEDDELIIGSQEPVMVFPPDIKRTRLDLTAFYWLRNGLVEPTSINFNWGSNRTDLYSTGAGVILSGAPLTLRNYTGALWVRRYATDFSNSPSDRAPVYLSWTAITS